jgi:hypothetical protein
MWTLIITILWYHAPAVATLPGFQTYEACNLAAKVERDALAVRYKDAYDPPTATYVCIKQN